MAYNLTYADESDPSILSINRHVYLTATRETFPGGQPSMRYLDPVYLAPENATTGHIRGTVHAMLQSEAEAIAAALSTGALEEGIHRNSY